MSISCRYLHTNLTVKDIEKMKMFYVGVFNCIPVKEIQHLTGEWIEGITSVKDGEIKYVHLLFPGHGESGPELELIQYLNSIKHYRMTPDALGFGHLSFSVNNVHEALE